AATFLRAALIAIAILAGLVCIFGLGLAHNPLLTGDVLGGGAIINSLLPGYLLPAFVAAVLAYAAAPLGERYRHAASAAALVLALVYLLLETSVLFHGPQISLHRGGSLAELGIETTICIGVAAAVGWTTIRLAWHFPQQAFLGPAALAAVLFVAGPVLGYNPLLRWTPVAGGAVFNALIPGYLLPALASVLLALVVRPLGQTFPPSRWRRWCAYLSCLCGAPGA